MGEYSIGYIIREKRKSKEITQEQLAERVGTTREYISMIENGRAEDAAVLYAIGKVLKCSLIKRYAIGLQAEPIQAMAAI